MASPSQDPGRVSLSLGPQLPYPMGRFTLCREIGAGGMATVYLSKMRLAAGIERLVAVKTIHAHLAKERTFVDMFLDEAKIASHVSHPNVCAVYDFGDVGGIYYIAMEYLVGEPLIDLVNELLAQAMGPGGDRDILEAVPFLAARVIADAAEGLHAAHTLRGADGRPLYVVHRDVSPQNLFVTYEGSVKVVDFGCAKALERVTQTNTGVMKGKVSYAAPEQLQGQDVDARVDVFALGVCLWEALTLRQLFRRDNAILTAKAVLEEPVPRADEDSPWVPRELADIVDRALQRDPDRRFDSARELGRALRSFIAGAGTTFESAEVAEWMTALFPDRHRRTLTQLSEVEKVALPGSGRDSVSELAPRAGAETAEDLAALADAPTKLAKAPGASPRVNAWELSQPEDLDPVVLPTRGGRWAALGVLVALLVAGGAYAWFAERPAVEGLLGRQSAAGGDAPTDRQAPDDSASDDSASDASASDDSAPDDSASDAPASDDPASDAPAPDDSASDAPASDDPASDAPASDDPASDAPASDAPASDGDPREASGGSSDEARLASAGGARAAAGRRGEPAEAGSGSSEAAADEEIVRPTATLDFGTGPVTVRTTRGWAVVRHEGRSLGRTPLRTRLPVGEQRLRILPMGEEPGRTVTVRVEWGSVQTVTVPIDDRAFGNPY